MYDNSSETRKANVAKQHCENNGNVVLDYTVLVIFIRCLQNQIKNEMGLLKRVIVREIYKYKVSYWYIDVYLRQTSYTVFTPLYYSISFYESATFTSRVKSGMFSL